MLDSEKRGGSLCAIKMKEEKKRNKVVFVCSGNICRSPMGEAMLKHAVGATAANDPVRGLEICSAGISTVDGLPPSAHSEAALARVGIDISGYRSTALTQEIVDGAFAIFAMDDSHIGAIKSRFKNLPERVFRVLDMSKMERKTVFDPYGGNLDEYLQCRDDIATAIDGILKYLQNETKV